MTSAVALQDERLAFVVPVCRPVVDGALQFGDAVKNSSANHAIGHQPEPALHFIQPELLVGVK